MTLLDTHTTVNHTGEADRDPERSQILHRSEASQQVPLMEIDPPTGWAALDLREVWQYRDLLFVLAQRDIKLRYKQTALGVVWVVLQPLIAAGIFAFVFGAVLKAPSDGVPYLMFAFAGLLGYNVFGGTLTKASACVVVNSQLVSKVYFPRLILPLSTIGSTLIDFAVASALMVMMMAHANIWPGIGVMLLPVWLLLMTMLAVGLGLYTSALMVSYRDLQYVIPVLLQFVLYASPVAFPVAKVPQSLRFWFYANPMAGLLEAFRWSLMSRGSINWMAVGYSTIVVVVVFFFGAFSFKRMERKFADVI